MRLFVALDIGDDTRAQLARVREALAGRLAAARRTPRVTWVKADAAHVTLRFIGDVDDAVGARVATALAAPLPAPPFDIEWGDVGAFPGMRRPRIIWLGATAGDEQAAALARAINERLVSLVGPPEDRPFRVHLSVGRVRDTDTRFDWEAAFQAIAPGTTRSRIDHVTLYQSRLSPTGPTYTALTVTPLAPRQT